MVVREISTTAWDGVDALILLEHEGEWKIAALMFTSDEQ